MSGYEGFDELLGSNLVIVTGKGGVGKTTVAAALALTGTASGRRTLLVEVEDRQGLSRLFETAPWDYEEREFRPGLWGTALDPGEAVYEYLERFYGVKRVRWFMERAGALDFVTTAAPGLRDLLLVGKLYEAESRRREDGRRAYDLIVLDAPPTGRIVPFLQSPQSVTEIVQVGTIERQAGQISSMVTDPSRTAAVLVTLLEEMPLAETVEAVGALQSAGVAVGPVIANQLEIPRLTAEQATALEDLGPAGLASRAAKAGADIGERTGGQALRLAASHRDRLRRQRRLRERLAEQVDTHVLDLPLMVGARFDADDVEVLADLLARQVGESGPRARGLDFLERLAWTDAG